MTRNEEPRIDPSDDKSDASPSGPGLKPANASKRSVVPGQERDWGKPRNTPPDNPFDQVKTRSNE